MLKAVLAVSQSAFHESFVRTSCTVTSLIWEPGSASRWEEEKSLRGQVNKGQWSHWGLWASECLRVQERPGWRRQGAAEWTRTAGEPLRASRNIFRPNWLGKKGKKIKNRKCAQVLWLLSCAAKKNSSSPLEPPELCFSVRIVAGREMEMGRGLAAVFQCQTCYFFLFFIPVIWRR